MNLQYSSHTCSWCTIFFIDFFLSCMQDLAFCFKDFDFSIFLSEVADGFLWSLSLSEDLLTNFRFLMGTDFQKEDNAKFWHDLCPKVFFSRWKFLCTSNSNPKFHLFTGGSSVDWQELTSPYFLQYHLSIGSKTLQSSASTSVYQPSYWGDTQSFHQRGVGGISRREIVPPGFSWIVANY